MKYRNAILGRTIERHEVDEWLEASGTWERIDDEPEPELEADDTKESEED